MSKKLQKIFKDHVDPYSRSADQRAAEYDRIDPEKMYAPLLPLLPQAPARILDIGAGSGRDAQWLASLGHDVVAVEPSPQLRAYIAEKATAARPGRIDTRGGHLPELTTLRDGETFDLILLGAVWQHVPPRDRKAAFNKIAAHLAPGGTLYMLLREGPAPEGRKMYRVTASAAARLARAERLQKLPLDNIHSQDLLGRSGVRWTPFAARK